MSNINYSLYTTNPWLSASTYYQSFSANTYISQDELNWILEQYASIGYVNSAITNLENNIPDMTNVMSNYYTQDQVNDIITGLILNEAELAQVDAEISSKLALLPSVNTSNIVPFNTTDSSNSSTGTIDNSTGDYVVMQYQDTTNLNNITINNLGIQINSNEGTNIQQGSEIIATFTGDNITVLAPNGIMYNSEPTTYNSNTLIDVSYFNNAISSINLSGYVPETFLIPSSITYGSMYPEYPNDYTLTPGVQVVISEGSEGLNITTSIPNDITTSYINTEANNINIQTNSGTSVAFVQLSDNVLELYSTDGTNITSLFITPTQMRVVGSSGITYFNQPTQISNYTLASVGMVENMISGNTNSANLTGYLTTGSTIQDTQIQNIGNFLTTGSTLNFLNISNHSAILTTGSTIQNSQIPGLSAITFNSTGFLTTGSTILDTQIQNIGNFLTTGSTITTSNISNLSSYSGFTNYMTNTGTINYVNSAISAISGITGGGSNPESVYNNLSNYYASAYTGLSTYNGYGYILPPGVVSLTASQSLPYSLTTGQIVFTKYLRAGFNILKTLMFYFTPGSYNTVSGANLWGLAVYNDFNGIPYQLQGEVASFPCTTATTSGYQTITGLNISLSGCTNNIFYVGIWTNSYGGGHYTHGISSYLGGFTTAYDFSNPSSLMCYNAGAYYSGMGSFASTWSTLNWLTNSAMNNGQQQYTPCYKLLMQ